MVCCRMPADRVGQCLQEHWVSLASPHHHMWSAYTTNLSATGSWFYWVTLELCGVFFPVLSLYKFFKRFSLCLESTIISQRVQMNFPFLGGECPADIKNCPAPFSSTCDRSLWYGRKIALYGNNYLCYYFLGNLLIGACDLDYNMVNFCKYFVCTWKECTS